MELLLSLVAIVLIIGWIIANLLAYAIGAAVIIAGLAIAIWILWKLCEAIWRGLK